MVNSASSTTRGKPNRRDADLHLRLSPHDKRLLETAATRLDLSLSEFVRGAALREAKQVGIVAQRVLKNEVFG